MQVLDSIEESARATFHHDLLQLGVVSDRLAAHIAEALQSSTKHHPTLFGVLPDQQYFPKGSFREQQQPTSADSGDSVHRIAFLGFADIHTCMASLKGVVEEVLTSVRSVADVWNAAIDEQAKAHSNMTCKFTHNEMSWRYTNDVHLPIAAQ